MAKSINRSIRIFVNGKEVEHSLNNVRKEMLRLSREVNSLEKGSAEYVKKSAEYRKVAGYFREIRQEITGMPTMFDRLSKSAGGFVSILTGFFAISSITGKFRQLIDLSAELAEKQSDVQKTTGMTKKEVRELTEELDKLETRTSRIDLLSIAVEGGRMGIAKEDIAEFTAAMDKANVALGDVFGSASEVASVLGKLRFMYQETADMGVSEAYNAIGSALNELGKNGIATEKNVAAFATRVGALPDAFKPSIAESLALGAAFEESGVEANVAARSYSILIQTAANNTQEFAKVMGMTNDEVINLINTNPTEFFLQFTNSFKGMDTEGTKMAATLKSLGVSATGVNMIIGAASNNNDRFRESIELSTKALEEGTSMTDEFNVKNENLAASLDKIQKGFIEWIGSDRVQNFLEGLVNWFGGLIGAIDNSDKKASTFIKTLDFSVKTIAVLIASFVSWTAAMKLSALWSSINVKNTQLFTVATKGSTLAQTLNTLAVSTAGMVYHRLSGNIFAARRAQVAFNSAIRANPLGLVLTALTAVIGAVMIYNSRIKQAAAEQKAFGEAVREAHKEAVEGISKTVSKIDSLINAIKDENISLETRKKAYEELIKIAPEFNGLLEDEKFNIEGLTKVYKQYVLQLQSVARAKATVKLAEDSAADVQRAAAEIYQIEQQLADERAKLQKLKEEGKQLQSKTTIDEFGIITTYEVESKVYKSQREAVEDLEKALKNLTDTQENLEEKQASLLDFRTSELEKVSKEIENLEAVINSFELLDTEQSQRLAEQSKARLAWLKQEKEILQGFKDDPGDDGGAGSGGGSGSGDGEKEIARRQKIADELLKIEIKKNRQLRDERLKTRKEEAELMVEGFHKEVELLNIQREEKINKLTDELEDIKALRAEYLKKALEEEKAGNKAGADGFRAQADVLIQIADEKNKTKLHIEETHRLNIEKLRYDYFRKHIEEEQKQYERRLKNLETEHNNELKSITNLEEAKQLLRDKYGLSPEELDKVKNFEKAKSKIAIEQQRETLEMQSEQLENQIKQLQDSLATDDLLAETSFGRMFDEEKREEILEFIEELENRLSKLQNPEEEEDTSDLKKNLSFIDVFGFSAEQWQNAFDNLDTLSGKIAFAQMAVQALSNAWSQYYETQEQNRRRDLDKFTKATDRKKRELDKQLEEGYISQAFYNAKVEKLDAELENKRAELEYQSAMQKWKASIIEANVNTALGITAALSMGVPGIVMAAIIGALGLFQLAMISRNKPKKPQGYFDGGESGSSGRFDSYGRELADGPLHANEYVIPEWLRRDPQIAQMEAFIEARRLGRNPETPYSVAYNDPGSNIPQGRTPEPPVVSTFQEDFITVMKQMNATLEDLRDNPIEAKLTRTMETARSISDDLQDYKNHRLKNKR